MSAKSPGDAILKTAEEEECDLIVIGCRGRSTLRRTILGTVSDYIVHHASVPVSSLFIYHIVHHASVPVSSLFIYHIVHHASVPLSSLFIYHIVHHASVPVSSLFIYNIVNHASVPVSPLFIASSSTPLCRLVHCSSITSSRLRAG